MSVRLLPLMLLCVACGPVIAQDHGAHRAAPVTADAPRAEHRWTADAPLRAGMQDIRVAVDALGHYEHGHLGQEQAVLIAGNIERHVGDIVAQCRLAPDADAALHAIIVPLARNAAVLKADPKRLEAIAPMRQALADYARQFDDGIAAGGKAASH